MPANDLAIVILAAGKGTRLKSSLAKVLHRAGEPFDGRSRPLLHLPAAAGAAGFGAVARGPRRGRALLAGLREITTLKESSMPSYKDKLSPQELADLINYLVSLKGSVKP